MTDHLERVTSEGGSDAPFFLDTAKILSDLDRLDEHKPQAVGSTVLLLQSVSNDRLINALRIVLTRSQALERDGAMVLRDGEQPSLDFDRALLIGAELTRRGCPPVFRKLPYYCEADTCKPHWHDADSDLLALMLDAQWLAARHRLSKIAWAAAARIYDAMQFRATCNWLHWGGRRSPGQIAIALGLTPSQQAEMAFIQYLPLARHKRRLWGLRPVAAERIRVDTAEQTYDRRTTEQREATASRREAIWLCGELADGKPQRTAELLEMLTGEALARGVVARHLEKLPNVRRTPS